jgi:hypothetical protein
MAADQVDIFKLQRQLLGICQDEMYLAHHFFGSDIARSLNILAGSGGFIDE